MGRGTGCAMGEVDDLVYILEKELLSRTGYPFTNAFVHTKGMKVEDIYE